ncbi:gb [Venturia nashicola]|uniref:Gb n=1 Tax=Venturia nashicola TaxID=86259 RepID=A0A4Z1PD45_9PEZI|nr:gb [Venturia nashicola]TLD35854.1 gb [Venturia nashicola]
MSTKKAGIFGVIQESWRAFTPTEKRNIATYIAGIMLYKFGLEAFNGSIAALATNRECAYSLNRASTYGRVPQVTTVKRSSMTQPLARSRELAFTPVMAFLYSTYIMYAIACPPLGRYIDDVYNRSGGANGGDIRPAIRNVAGVQFTVLCAVALASTFIPKGAISFNPEMINGEELDNDLPDDADSMEKGKESAPSSLAKVQNEKET